MNIAIYTPYFFPESGACSVRVNSFKETFTSLGHNVTIFVPRKQNVSYSAGIKTFKGNSDLFLKIFREKCEVIIGTSPPLFPNFFIFLAAKLSGKKFVFDAKDPYTYIMENLGLYKKNSPKLSSFKLIEKIMYKNSDLVLFLTPRDRAESIKKYKMEEEKAVLAQNGFDPSVGKFSSKHRNELRNKILKNKSAKILIYAGSISDEKLDEFIEGAAGKIVKQFGVELLFVLSLEKTENSKRQLTDLLNLVRKKGIEKNFHYFVNVPFGEMGNYYSTADIALIPIPSFWETCLPVKVFDSLYFALPLAIKGPKQGSLKDFVDKNGGGFYSSNWQEFIEKLGSALGNFNYLREEGMRGKKAILNNYSRKKINKKLVERIQLLL